MKSWDYKLLPDLAAIRPAAACFRQWASAQTDDAAVADCELALVEACNNLINHNQNIREAITLHAEATPSELTIIIRDSTAGFEWPSEPHLPEPNAERGRGIYMMHALMTQVDYHRDGRQNLLRLRRTFNVARSSF